MRFTNFSGRIDHMAEGKVHVEIVYCVV